MPLSTQWTKSLPETVALTLLASTLTLTACAPSASAPKEGAEQMPQNESNPSDSTGEGAAMTVGGPADAGEAPAKSDQESQPAGHPCDDPTVTFNGSLYVFTRDELDSIATYKCITRDLSIGIMGAENIELPAIESIGGSFSISASTTLVSFRATKLRQIGGGADFGSLSYPTELLSIIDLPSLTRVGGRLQFSGNAALERLSLPALSETSHLMIDSNPLLTRIDMPALVTVEFLTIEHNERLARCSTDPIVERLLQNSVDPTRIQVANTDPNASCTD